MLSNLSAPVPCVLCSGSGSGSLISRILWRICLLMYQLDTKYEILCVLLAQWITWLTRDHCNPKVPSSIPAGDKDFPWARKFNHIALCLGGHIKVRVPGATIARKNTCVIITPQYYALKWALLSINQNQMWLA